MERRIYGPELIPKAWQPEMRIFTENEFLSKVTIDGQLRHTTSDTITASYNRDRYNPVDGELVKAADDLAAFMEAYLGCKTAFQIHNYIQPFERSNCSTATGRLPTSI